MTVRPFVGASTTTVVASTANGRMTLDQISGRVNVTLSAATTGQSGQQVGVPATGNSTYPWKVVGVYEDAEDNDVAAAYANLIVIPNNHLYKGGTGTAGV